MSWLCVNTLAFIEITCQLLQISEFSFLSLHPLFSITSWARWLKFTEPHVLSCGPSHVVAFLKEEGRESGSGCPVMAKVSLRSENSTKLHHTPWLTYQQKPGLHFQQRIELPNSQSHFTIAFWNIFLYLILIYLFSSLSTLKPLVSRPDFNTTTYRAAGPGAHQCVLSRYLPTLHVGPRPCFLKERDPGTSLGVQWLRLRAPNAGGSGSIPGQGTMNRSHRPQLKIPHATTKMEDSECCN